MPKRMEERVLIIGAGPVGLSLALDLAWRGQRSIIIEKGQGTVTHSKMGSIAVRTMEFCRRWGIVEDVRNSGFPEDYPLNQVFCTSLNGFHVATLHYPSMRDQTLTEASPEKYRRCPQLWFDPMLAACVARTGMVDIRYGHELVSLKQTDGCVIAEIRCLSSGEIEEFECEYLVGCDGPGSTVRKQLGISLEGEPLLSYSNGIYLTAPDLPQRHDKAIAERYVLIGPEGNWGSLTVVDGVGRWRLTVNGNREKDGNFDAEWWVRRAFGDDSIAFTIESVLPWRRGQLVAERYREGRVFLAGDAAHIMAPNGGYGMNTGIADAVDLSWKLDAVLNGWGGPGLLDSYDVERRPVGKRNVDAAAGNFAKANPKAGDWLFDDSASGFHQRAQFGATLEEATRAQWERLGVVLGHRYENSPICIPDGSPAPADDHVVYVPTSRPGHRAPHAWLSSDHSTLDLFGKGFVLLQFGEAAVDTDALEHAFRTRGIPFQAHHIADPFIAELYEKRFVLVRPDGHSAWRGDRLEDNPDKVVDAVRGAASAFVETRHASDGARPSLR